MVAARLGQGRSRLDERLGGRFGGDQVVADVGQLRIAEDRRDPDLQSTAIHDPIERRDPRIESDQADVGAYEWRRRVAHGRHRRHDLLGPAQAGGINHQPTGFAVDPDRHAG